MQCELEDHLQMKTEGSDLRGRKRNEGLQALRALAFLGIFFIHSGFVVSWGQLGVSVFFVLSGFLMVLVNKEQTFELSLAGSLQFSWNRIKKLYPLHLLTMTAIVLLSLVGILRNGTEREALLTLARDIVLNITLLQTWIPDNAINVSLNGVAWYLSVMAFLYFLFPCLKAFMNRKTNPQLLLLAALLWVTGIALSGLFIERFGAGSPVTIWFTYCFPVFRFGDFFAGAVLGKFAAAAASDSKTRSSWKMTAAEVMATALTVLAFCFIRQPHQSIVLRALHNWTSIYIPLAVIWVALFYTHGGWLTHVLTNKLFVKLGDLSPFLFLIHYVVIQYAGHLLSFLHIKTDGLSRAGLVFAELMITIVLSLAYRGIQQRIKRRPIERE